MTNARTTVRSVEPLEERRVRLSFADGAVHEVDLAAVFARGGVFARIRDDPSTFAAVRVDEESGTIAWPGNIDLDPDVLRGDAVPASGEALPRRVVLPA